MYSVQVTLEDILCSLLPPTHTFFGGMLTWVDYLGDVSITHCRLLFVAFSSLCLHFINWHALCVGSELYDVCAVLLVLPGISCLMSQDPARTHPAVAPHQTASTGTARLLLLLLLQQAYPAVIIGSHRSHASSILKASESL